METISRRQFQQLTLCGLAAAAAPLQQLCGSEEDELNNGWIDAHVHVWTPDVKTYPLDANYKVADMQPPSFTPAQLFEHTKPAGVSRIVLIQMSFYQFDNRYMLDMMAKFPRVFSGVGIVDHRSAEVGAKMKQLAKRGVRGFRIHPQAQEAAGWIKLQGMATLWETATAENLSVCPLINPSDIQHVKAMCEKFPETRVVIDHFARIGVSGSIDEQALDELCGLATFENVHVKTSAFYALGKKESPYTDLIPMIKRLVEAFGAERLMWASDCPYQVQGAHNYADSIALIRDRCDFLTEEQRNAILRGTAEKVFFS
jgi:predicted TIM-barrel fold metal-dependent hydrolase